MSPHILVVDDEDLIRRMQVSALSEKGYACLQAAGFEEACVILAQETIDLALLDITMPGRSGVQLLLEIRRRSPETAAIMVTSTSDLETALFCIRNGADDYITKPFHIDRVVVSVENVLKKHLLARENRAYQQHLERKVMEQTEKIRAALNDLRNSYDHTLAALARALDAREKETGSHSERVRAYALLLARTMDLAEPDFSALASGALLHDIGKIGVPDPILLKPGKLAPEEWEEIRKHPRIGHDIVVGVKFLESAAQIVLTHHERFDGSGYPLGLKGEEIPLASRIFTVADTLDAMTSHRPYRAALPLRTAVREILACRGTQFDPAVVETFLTIPKEDWEKVGGRKLD